MPMLSRQVLLAMLVSCALACDGQKALAPIQFVRLELSLLSIDSFLSAEPDSGFLAVRGEFADTSNQLDGNERLSVAVASSSGDVETLLLGPRFCYPGPTDCTLVLVSMNVGHSVDELNSVLAVIPARWWTTCVSRTCGAARVFELQRVDGAIRTLRRHPGVADADRDGVGTLPIDAPTPNWAVHVFGAAPLDYGDSRPHDGRVQVQSGDTITVEYVQPDGSSVVDQIVLR